MYLVLFMCGALLGMFLAGVPGLLFMRDAVEMPKGTFTNFHPHLRWVAQTFPAVNLISLMPAVYAFLLLFIPRYSARPDEFVFFFPLFIITAVGLSNAFYEIVAGASPTASRGRGIGNTYAVHPNARKCGIVRIASLLMVTCAAVYFCWLR